MENLHRFMRIINAWFQRKVHDKFALTKSNRGLINSCSVTNLLANPMSNLLAKDFLTVLFGCVLEEGCGTCGGICYVDLDFAGYYLPSNDNSNKCDEGKNGIEQRACRISPF